MGVPKTFFSGKMEDPKKQDTEAYVDSEWAHSYIPSGCHCLNFHI